MTYRRCLGLILALCLIFSVSAAGVDSAQGAKDSLYGKTLLVLGDSYTAAYGLQRYEDCWPWILAEHCGMTQLNYSISGSSFAAGPNGYSPMVERCRELPTDKPVDIILVQGGSNDFARNVPLGDLSSRDETTFCGALTLILDYLEETYPEAQIVCFTPWISNAGANSDGLLSADYTAAMVALCENRGILCYDASQADQNGMYLSDEAFRSRFCLTATDRYHLNPAGHRRFAPIIAQWLCENLYGSAPSDRYTDLSGASESLRDAVDTLAPAGILTGTGDRLFSPTRAADRADLAQCLYRLAGEPSVTDHTFSDLSAQDLDYQALCYMVDTGLYGESSEIQPKQVLTRQMLATVLYRYYTDLLAHFVDNLTGLGSYPDGDQVAAYAKLPMGWALAAGVLQDKDGWLRPGSAVSRGELAETLTAFLRYIGEFS